MKQIFILLILFVVISSANSQERFYSDISKGPRLGMKLTLILQKHI
jgi:hypothetical protein